MISLPQDVLILLLEFLHPLFIIHLYKKNKYFHNSSKCITIRQKYAKTMLQKLINTNYILFINCIRNIKFDSLFIKQFLYDNITRQQIPVIWINNYICGYYDLKYIFEIIYYMYKNNIDSDYFIIKQLNTHFARCYYNEFQKVMNESRIVTIQNINNTVKLLSLHRQFVGYNKLTRKPVSILIDYHI